MKVYLVSLAAGVLVGVLYALLQVCSPAPPAIALIGLLGMLLGEQMVPAAKRLMAGSTVTTAWLAAECLPRITGLPARQPLHGLPARGAASGEPAASNDAP